MYQTKDRRAFLKDLGTAGLIMGGAGLPIAGAMTTPLRTEKPLVGIQISPLNFLDEGMEACLGRLETAGINALFCYSQTYHLSYNKPVSAFASRPVQPRSFAGRGLRHQWIQTHPEFYKDTLLSHEKPNPAHEYHNRDIFTELLQPARQRGMKVYARILEASANRRDLIPNYEKVLTVDINGHTGRGPCWNHPDYRAWISGTVKDLVTHYDIAGLQYGAERTGPLSYLLYRGLVPTCFCEHCTRRNKAKNIDAGRAREGYQQLYQFIQKVEADVLPADGVLASVYGYLQRYPEILSWNYQWFQADNEIHQEIYDVAKAIKPDFEIGRHVDHQRSSWDIWYRAAVPYSDMAGSADFVKPIVYHDILGPRLRNWVIKEMHRHAWRDKTEAEILQEFYALFGYDSAQMPALEELNSRGLGAAYVQKETERCVKGLNGGAKVYTGLGVDVPWHLPEGGMAPFPSPPDVLTAAIHGAFQAGADGILISREYEEIRLESLKTIGQAMAAIHRP
jgi:hypothetical protein